MCCAKGDDVPLLYSRAMSRDEVVYPDSEAFKPERYFDAKGNLMDEKLVGYGFGRRRV